MPIRRTYACYAAGYCGDALLSFDASAELTMPTPRTCPTKCAMRAELSEGTVYIIEVVAGS